MKVAIVCLSSLLLLVGCAASDLSDLPSSSRSAPAVVAIKPFVGNPNVFALNTQLQQNYAGSQVQVLRVGNEVKVTYPADLLFGVGGVELMSGSQDLLDPFINQAKAYPQAKLRVDSFTDNSGIQANNITRSEDRAQNVARYLVDNGLSAENMTLKGYGSDYYVASNETTEGRAQNRRIVITISPPFPLLHQETETINKAPLPQPVK